MNGIFLIIACLILGKILGTKVKSRQNFILTLNSVAINIALPALILNKIHAQNFSLEAIIPLLSPWIVFALSVAFIYLIKLWIPMSRATTGCLILLSGTSNTSFVGIPLIQALMGTDNYIGVAIWVDQSNFFLLFTLGVFIANFYTGQTSTLKANITGLLSYTPIIALIIALLLKPFPYPDFFQYTLEQFGQLVTPLTMLSVGASLQIPRNPSLLKNISIGLGVKLILIPFVIYLLLRFIFSSSIPEINQVVLMQAGMAPMVVAAIIATEKNLNPELASLLTAIGIPFSFITVGFWYWLIV